VPKGRILGFETATQSLYDAALNHDENAMLAIYGPDVD
jgi:hypothetical protein